jgi:hypothetical protein
MDATITYNEVASLVGVNFPPQIGCPSFESIPLLHRHLEQALQLLPCPQSTLHRWKGLVMNRALYVFLTTTPYCTPNDPGASAVYIRPLNLANPKAILDATPLTRTEQATIDTTFNCREHYFLSMRNIECACFTVLDLSINDAYKVSNNPAIQGWHAGMSLIFILNQLSNLYGQPTPTILGTNDKVFPSPYSAADAPKVLFPRIKECAKTALLGNREGVVAELILMVNPLYRIMSVAMLNYEWCLVLRSVLGTSGVWPK